MPFFFGGDDRDRTDYLLNAIQALSQVSYAPKCLSIIPSLFAVCKRVFQKFSRQALLPPGTNRTKYRPAPGCLPSRLCFGRGFAEREGRARRRPDKRKEAPYGALFSFGGDDRDRTDYLLNAIQALSQVSYTPECLIIIASPPPACKRFFQNCSGLSKTLLLFHKQCCYLSALHKRGKGIAEGKTAVRNRKAKAEKPILTGKSSQNPLKKPNYRRCFSAKMPIE